MHIYLVSYLEYCQNMVSSHSGLDVSSNKGSRLLPSVQRSTSFEGLGQVGSDSNPAASTNVGNKSTNSTAFFVLMPSSVTPGIRIMKGTLLKKILILHTVWIDGILGFQSWKFEPVCDFEQVLLAPFCVFSKLPSVITPKDNNGIISNTESFQVLQNSSYFMITVWDCRIIGSTQFLGFPIRLKYYLALGVCIFEKWWTLNTEVIRNLR